MQNKTTATTTTTTIATIFLVPLYQQSCMLFLETFSFDTKEIFMQNIILCYRHCKPENNNLKNPLIASLA